MSVSSSPFLHLGSGERKPEENLSAQGRQGDLSAKFQSCQNDLKTVKTSGDHGEKEIDDIQEKLMCKHQSLSVIWKYKQR